MPIPLGWQDILYLGPPHIGQRDDSDPLAPEAEAMFEATKLELAAEARTQARERLVAAWRAPA
jgi:hypothetical protein